MASRGFNFGRAQQKDEETGETTTTTAPATGFSSLGNKFGSSIFLANPSKENNGPNSASAPLTSFGKSNGFGGPTQFSSSSQGFPPIASLAGMPAASTGLAILQKSTASNAEAVSSAVIPASKPQPYAVSAHRMTTMTANVPSTSGGDAGMDMSDMPAPPVPGKQPILFKSPTSHGTGLGVGMARVPTGQTMSAPPKVSTTGASKQAQAPSRPNNRGEPAPPAVKATPVAIPAKMYSAPVPVPASRGVAPAQVPVQQAQLQEKEKKSDEDMGHVSDRGNAGETVVAVGESLGLASRDGLAAQVSSLTASTADAVKNVAELEVRATHAMQAMQAAMATSTAMQAALSMAAAHAMLALAVEEVGARANDLTAAIESELAMAMDGMDIGDAGMQVQPASVPA